MMLQPNAITPTIVQVVEPPTQDVSVVDVVFDALSLTGVITIIAILAGVAFGAALIYYKRRRDEMADQGSTRLNLSSH